MNTPAELPFLNIAESSPRQVVSYPSVSKGSTSLPCSIKSSRSSVTAITSGKGGVGKTSIAVNLAVALARLGRSVVLFDADTGLANIDVALGLKPKFDISDLLAGRKALKEIMLPGPYGIQVIPASTGVSSMASLSQAQQGRLMREFECLEDSVDHLIVDTAAGIDSSVLNYASACGDILVVLCDEPTSLADAYATIKALAIERQVTSVQVLVNQVQGDQQALRLFARLQRVVGQFLKLELEYAGFIPFDFYMQKALLKRSSLVQSYPRSISATALKKLADRVDNRTNGNEMRGGLGFFANSVIHPKLLA